MITLCDICVCNNVQQLLQAGSKNEGSDEKSLDIYPLPPSKSLALSLKAWSRSLLSSSSRRFSSFSFRISSSNLLFLFTSLIWKKLKGPSSHDQISLKVIPLDRPRIRYQLLSKDGVINATGGGTLDSKDLSSSWGLCHYAAYVLACAQTFIR